MILLAFIWGSSFILMKKGLVVFNDLEVAQLRMGIAWLSLLPFVWNKLFSIEKKAYYSNTYCGFVWKRLSSFFVY